MAEPSVGAGAAPVAYIQIRGHDGTFVAETCEIADGMVTATGRTRRPTGAHYADYAWGPRSSYSWPTRAICRIRWLEVEV